MLFQVFTWHLVCICQCGYCSGLPQQTDKFTIVITGCSSLLKQPQIVYNYSIAKGWLKLVSIIQYIPLRMWMLHSWLITSIVVMLAMHAFMHSLIGSHQEFITVRVCNCHRVSTTAISAVWRWQSVVNMFNRYLTWSRFKPTCTQSITIYTYSNWLRATVIVNYYFLCT